MSDTRSDLLLELGFEELPTDVVLTQCTFLDDLRDRLTKDGFIESNAATSTEILATPRRLAVHIPAVLAELPEQTVERKGPSLDRAYKEGEPTPAALGFAKSCGAEVEQLEQRDGYLYFCGERPGACLAERLAEHIEQTLAALPARAKMRWSTQRHAFARPLRWLLALHGDTPLDITVMGVAAGNTTVGHRSYCDEPVALQSADIHAYQNTLREQAKVWVSFNDRSQRITEALKNTFGEPQDSNPFDTSPDPCRTIATENAALVEYPHAVVCAFDASYIERLPAALIIEALMVNQKFLLGFAEPGKLSNQFLVITNIEPRDANEEQQLRHRFERVAHPRLADAVFFFENDLKQPLGAYREGLRDLRFYKGLGSVFDKTLRIEALGQQIANQLSGIDQDLLQQAAQLCKADLLTDSVREYPSLQGLIGQYCLEHAGAAALGKVVMEHYLPRYAGDDLPTSEEACVLGIADRIDSLVSFFAVGLRSSGSKDPYGLRRMGSAVVRLVLQLGERHALDLSELISQSAQLLEQQQGVALDAESATALTEHLLDRIKQHYSDQLVPRDQIEAVCSTPACNPLCLSGLAARVSALQSAVNKGDILPVIAASKRIRNILKKSEATETAAVDESLLADAAEQALHRAAAAHAEAFSDATQAHDYDVMLESLAGLRGPCDDFFDQVLVMAEDQNLRRNRMNLLREVEQQFMRVADFSKIQLKGE